jgi:methylmalonyl-CoA/ethylmalonyl-CoA epimerase
VINKIAHLGVAVKNIEEAEKLYTEVFSLKIHDREQSGGMKASFIPVGDTAIELLQSTDPEGVIAKFVEKRGEGIHHIAYEVKDIRKILEYLKTKGFNLIDKEPRKGAHNSKVAFLHPKSTHGVLIELVEPE